MLIYKITNLLNNKIYIGQEKNFNESYFGSGLAISKALLKYGRENFKKEIIENGIEYKSLLDEREIFWIKFHNSQNKNIGYNIAAGGQGGDFLSQEAKDARGLKISKKRLSIPLSEYHKSQIKEAFNQKHPKCENIKKSNYSHFGEENSFFGKKHTGDMSRFSTQHGKTPVNALRMQDDKGNIYNSADEASKQFPNPNTARRAIVDVCRGRRQNFRGVVFTFIEKLNEENE